MKSGAVWPIAIIGILALTVVGNLAVIKLAVDDPSFGVEPDYYQKALHWDEAMARARRNLELGWTPHLELAREIIPGVGQRRMIATLTLLDRDGQAVDDVEITAICFHNARSADPRQVAFTPAGAGRFRASIELVRPGLYEFRLQARRGAEMFTATLIEELS